MLPQPINYIDWLWISLAAAVGITAVHLVWRFWIHPVLAAAYDLDEDDETQPPMPLFLGAAVGFALAGFIGFIWLVSIFGSLFHE